MTEFPELTRLEVDTPEKQKAYDQAEKALSEKLKNPASKFWRMRVRRALNRLEELYGKTA
jgi:hypothetical protein